MWLGHQCTVGGCGATMRVPSVSGGNEVWYRRFRLQSGWVVSVVSSFGVSMSPLVRLGLGLRVGMGFEDQCILGTGSLRG